MNIHNCFQVLVAEAYKIETNNKSKLFPIQIFILTTILLVLKFPATPFVGFLECIPTICGTRIHSQRQAIERAETNYRLIPNQVEITENTGVSGQAYAV